GGVVEAGGVTVEVGAAHLAQQQGAVFGAAAHGASLVERRGERDHAVAAGAAIGGLDAGDAAEASGLADGATGVGTGHGGGQTGGHGHGLTAGLATGHALGVPGVAHGLGLSKAHGGNGGIFVGAAHGEFVAVELAQVDHAGFSQLGYYRGIKRRL